MLLMKTITMMTMATMVMMNAKVITAAWITICE